MRGNGDATSLPQTCPLETTVHPSNDPALAKGHNVWRIVVKTTIQNNKPMVQPSPTNMETFDDQALTIEQTGMICKDILTTPFVQLKRGM